MDSGKARLPSLYSKGDHIVDATPSWPTFDKPPEDVDIREQLFNQGLVGPIQHVQVSTERVTQLLGILFDLDPVLYRPGGLVAEIPVHPDQFYTAVVQPCLVRNPVLSKAEVRRSGTGIHAILHLHPPVVFETAGERDRWAGIV